MGWFAVIGSPMVIIGFIVAAILDGEIAPVVIRVIWVPILFMWGIREIRLYRAKKDFLRRSNHG